MEKQTKDKHEAVGNVMDRKTFSQGGMLTGTLFNFCENPHPYTCFRTHNLTVTSPVTGSFIKLTGRGLSGQGKTSEPYPSCHDMMDLSSTGCQAVTQVHRPVAFHQETLAKHPVDQLIWIYPPTPFTLKSDCTLKEQSRLALLASSLLFLNVKMCQKHSHMK